MHENYIHQLQGNGLRGNTEVTKEGKKISNTFQKRRTEANKAKITTY